MKPPLRAFVLTLALSSSAPAAVVNIDFNHVLAPVPFSGLAAADDPAGNGAFWNSVVRPGSEDEIESGYLSDSTGALTSVALSLGVNASYVSAGDQELGGSPGEYLGLMSDYFYLSADSPGMVISQPGVISGLIPTNTYDLYFYSQGNHFAGGYENGQNGLFTVAGESKQTAWDGFQGGDGRWVEGIEYVRFTVQADSEGKISFTWANVVAGLGGNVEVDADGKTSLYAALNALQIIDHKIELVPEPSVALLCSVGLLTLLRRRRP